MKTLPAFLISTGIIVGIGVTFVLIADRALPPELIEQTVHSQTFQGNTVYYVECCTGGGIGSCEFKPPPPTGIRNAILIKRSRLLGSCSVEPLHRMPTPCQCD